MALVVLDTEYDGQKPRMTFIDATGIGGPIVDRVRQLGHRNVVEVQFGGKPPDGVSVLGGGRPRGEGALEGLAVVPRGRLERNPPPMYFFTWPERIQSPGRDSC